MTIYKVYAKCVRVAEEFFEKNGFFECGDFIIERSEEYPSRSNGYGWSDFE